ncbi:MAG: DUF485 domain-containing protein [Novosphingobium sp.]|nr:DUF485 domain-containing protein [Novosphingobium sp.]
MTESQAAHAAMASDPRYRALVQDRARFGWLLTFAICAIYFGYVLLIAFRPDILARPIGQGVTTLGIPVGLGVILAGVALTAICVWRANRHYDPAMQALREEHGA